ncbi:MAG: hypothetical protein P1P64_09950 [Treponemataceae bacterium]
MKKIFLCLLFSFLSFFALAKGANEAFANDYPPSENIAKAPASKKDKADKGQKVEKQTLPKSYRGISLGMSLESVKDALLSDKLFGYRGERDFTLLASPNRSAIETAGTSFIERAWFQFSEESLYTITLKLNTDKVDHYSIYKHFCEKYGEPLDINPQRAVWEDTSVRITIERPLTVKYLDLGVFNSMLEKDKTETADSELKREAFINEF